MQGNPGGASDELQQPGPALFVKRLHSLPEPLDDVAVWSAVLEARVGLPIVDVNFSQATYDELQVEEIM